MSNDLKERIRADLTTARKGRDKGRTVLLTTVLADIRNREIDARRALTPEELVDVLARAVKQRREAAEQARSAGRPEIADKEEAEAEALTAYLPEQLDEAQVRALVREAIAGGADGVGPVMGRVMPRLKGRFDGKQANRIVREELSK